MSLTKYIRDIQSRFEAIPAPAALIYDAIPARILRKPENRIVIDVVKAIENKGTFLDLGSGTGYLTIEVAKNMPDLQVYGIDLSKKMVEIATRHAEGVKNAKFVYGNAADLLFEDDSVDFIISTGSLHHWKRPLRIFDECFRVLKNGKEAWIYDPCPDALTDDIDKAREKYGNLGHRFMIKITQLHGFTRQEYRSKIRRILDQSAFKDSYQMELTDIWMKTILKK